MPMIDVYATSGTFADPKALARDLAATLMKIEQVPDIPMFRQNTAAFVHYLSDGALSNVEGDSNYVRVQVLTNAGALDREKQLSVVRQFTDLVATAAGDPSVAGRTWVLLTEAVEGGWGLAGHANTNAELIDAARADCRAPARRGAPLGFLRRRSRHAGRDPNHRLPDGRCGRCRQAKIKCAGGGWTTLRFASESCTGCPGTLGPRDRTGPGGR